MTPYGTILTLLSDAARVEQQSRMQITVGYLTAVLSQADLEKAPSLEEILDGPVNEAEAEAAPVPEQDDPRANVRSWMAALGGAKRVQEPEPEQISEVEENGDG